VVERQDSLLARLGITNVLHQFLLLSLLTLIIWNLESIFEYAYARLWRNLAQTLQHNLRPKAYAHLQELELAYFEEHSTSGLLTILNDDCIYVMEQGKLVESGRHEELLAQGGFMPTLGQ